MDNLGELIVNLAPQLVLAAWIIWTLIKIIHDLLAMQKWMLEQLMKLHPPQDEPPQIIE